MLPTAPPTSSKEEKEEKANETTKKHVLVLWDFDWSLINDNSDFYVMCKLYGKQKYYNEIYPTLEQKAEQDGVTVFTDVMDQYAWPKLFHDFKLNKQSFTTHLCDIPIFEENIRVVKALGGHPQSSAHAHAQAQIRQYIVSDANTVLIESILEHHGLFPNIIQSKQIYTNPGWYDDKTGILRCRRYHTEQSPHNCPLNDSLNICKGKILQEEILKTAASSEDDRIIIYIGDGSGDYCPVTKLGKNDFAFVRKFDKLRGLEKRIAKEKDIQLKCSVKKWRDGKELLQCFMDAVPFVKF